MLRQDQTSNTSSAPISKPAATRLIQPLPNGVAPDGALCADPTCATITKVDIFGALAQEPNPYVYIYSFQTQLEPARNLVVTLGYQGSLSRKMIRTIDVNRLIPGDTYDMLQDKFQNSGSNLLPCGPTNPTCAAPHATGNNRFNRIFMPLPDVNASFNAGVLHVTKRFTRGFQLDTTYMWSHSIDTASYELGFQQTDPSNQLLNRGRSDYDVRQNFVFRHCGSCRSCERAMASSVPCWEDGRSAGS